MNEVIKVVSEFYGVNPFLENKDRVHSECRFMIWYFLFCKINEHCTTVMIGQIFRRDHSTIVQGLKRFRGLLDTEPQLRCKVAEIELLLPKDYFSKRRKTHNRISNGELKIHAEG